jgi:hypothetical protein
MKQRLLAFFAKSLRSVSGNFNENFILSALVLAKGKHTPEILTDTVYIAIHRKTIIFSSYWFEHVFRAMTEREYFCMAKNLYIEGRNEYTVFHKHPRNTPIQGMLAWQSA